MHNSTAKKVQGIADWVYNMAGAIRFLSVFIRGIMPPSGWFFWFFASLAPFA